MANWCDRHQRHTIDEVCSGCDAETTTAILATLRAKVADMRCQNEHEDDMIARILSFIDAEIARCQGGEK